jgi:thiamine biosynthesis lipoprotein
MENQTEFEAIGTHWNIEIEPSSEKSSSALFTMIRDRIEIFEQTYSRFRPDTLITRMSKQTGTYEFPPDSEQMWSLYKQLYTITKGAFTPLIGSLLSEAGYDASYSLTPKELHKPPRWEEALDDAFPRITTRQPVMLDLGSIGKGCLIDIVGELIEANGIQRYVINAGGDIRHRQTDGTPLRIALEHPGDMSRAIGIASIANQSLCGSSGSRRKWRQFHHIMNPRTLGSPSHVISAWTIADSTIIADALATCLYLVPPEDLIPYFDFEYLILRPDYSVTHSNGFQAELFAQQPPKKQ